MPRPRCLKPMRRKGRNADLDPVCWRPVGHEEKGTTKAAERHLSRRAYLNELRRAARHRNVQ
jgi:hypothetical protein